MCGSERLFRDGLRKLRDGSSIQRWLCRGCGYRFSFGPKNLMGKAEKSQPLALNPSSSLTSDRQGSHEGPDPGPSPSPDPKPEPDPGIGTGTGGGTGAPIALEAMKTLAGEAKGWKSQDAGATETSADISSKLVEFAWWMKKQGYAESTIAVRVNALKVLHKRKANLYDPESVKEAIARQKWSEGRKANAVKAYTTFLKMLGGVWQPPICRDVRRLPFIPLEREIDDLIASCNKHIATFLQLAKETGARAGEVFALKWTDVDLESKTIRITAEKGSEPRIFKISTKLIGMLNNLPRDSERIFSYYKSLKNLRRSFERYRKRVAYRLGNPRLLRISFHTLRHWKATTEYHRTKDILYVMQLLGHKSIKNTLVYTQLVKSQDEAEFVCKVAKTVDQASKLIEAGFEYVCEIDGIKLFRKRK